MVKHSTQKSNGWLRRIGASLVMLPVVVGALYFGYPAVDVLILLAGVLLCWEWTGMMKSRRTAVYLSAYLFSLAICLFVFNPYLNVAVIVLTSLFVWFRARDEEHRNLLTLGVSYLTIGTVSLAWVYYDAFAYPPYPPYSFYMTLWFCLMVWAMDVGGLLVGTTVKGPKLAPRISPNKTWSGLVGGMLLAVLVSVVYFEVLAALRWMGTDVSSQIFFGVIGMLIAGISQIGDLIESAIKRRIGVKDSSNLIPGHGGVFDRVDGLIFAAPFVYWLFKYGVSL